VRLQSYGKTMGWCTAQCEMLLHVKPTVREACNSELARLKKTTKKNKQKKKKEKH